MKGGWRGKKGGREEGRKGERKEEEEEWKRRSEEGKGEGWRQKRMKTQCF